MRRFQCALLAAVAVFGFASVASAADMPTKTPTYKAPVVAPAYNWSGFYVGVNGGYGWGDRSATFNPNDPNAQAASCGGAFGGTCALPTSFNVNGALGGLQAGYNWQFNQNWLLGVEADFDVSRIQGTGTSNFLLGSLPPGPSNFQASQNTKWFGTIRGRFGFLPTNQLLVYGTAGFAYGKVDENVVLNSAAGVGTSTVPFGFICLAGPNCFLGSSSRTATGWTAGAGFEYAPWNNNISIKGEYLYVSLGGGDAVNVVAQNSNGQPNPSSFTVAYGRTNFNVVRLGLNYKFGGPVISNY